MSNRVLYIIIFTAIFFGLLATLLNFLSQPTSDTSQAIENPSEATFCTMDAMQCPDGSFVGRTGPDCAFVCPTGSEVPLDVQTHINAKAEFITVADPAPLGVISSPLTISGQARGSWLFESDLPVTLVDWNGLIIAEGFVTAEGDWMTEDFVPFTGTLEFTSPYSEGNPDFMKRGTLILKKDNASGLPELDDALEIPVRFAP